MYIVMEVLRQLDSVYFLCWFRQLIVNKIIPTNIKKTNDVGCLFLSLSLILHFFLSLFFRGRGGGGVPKGLITYFLPCSYV